MAITSPEFIPIALTVLADNRRGTGARRPDPVDPTVLDTAYLALDFTGLGDGPYTPSQLIDVVTTALRAVNLLR